MCAKRSEQNFNGSLYEIVSYQNTPTGNQLTTTALLYPEQGIEQRKTAQPSLPELLCLPHRQPRGQGISLLALLRIVEVKIISLSPERLRNSIRDNWWSPKADPGKLHQSKLQSPGIPKGNSSPSTTRHQRAKNQGHTKDDWYCQTSHIL